MLLLTSLFKPFTLANSPPISNFDHVLSSPSPLSSDSPVLTTHLGPPLLARLLDMPVSFDLPLLWPSGAIIAIFPILFSYFECVFYIPKDTNGTKEMMSLYPLYMA